MNNLSIVDVASLVVIVAAVFFALFYFLNKKSTKAGIEEAREGERKKKDQRRVTVHLGIIDETLMQMSDADRIAYLDDLGKKQAENGIDWRKEAMQPRPNPFSPWLIDAIRSTAKRFDGETNYDDDNLRYVVVIPGDKERADQFCNALNEEWLKQGAKPENSKYKLTHRLSAQGFMADESQVMDDLVEHLSPGSHRAD